MNKDEARLSVMGAISMALKDPVLQQGFEVICKDLTELEKENAELKEEVKNNEDLATVAYMQGAGNQKKKYDKQLAKAESLITRLSTCFGSYAENIFENELLKEAEQFLKEVSE